MMVKQIKFKIRATKMGKRIVSDERYRIVAAAALGLSVNLLYAFYHGTLGIVNRSLWFITMCAYYTILSIMRFSAVLCERKTGSAASFATEYFVMKLSGILLAGLSFILTGVIYLSLAGNIVAVHDTVTMITIATYTFYKLIMAILRAVRQRKNPSPLLATIRSIGYADAAVSVLILQRSMLASFGSMSDSNAHRMNMLTGAVICFYVFMLGVFMTIKGIKRSGVKLWQNQKSYRQMK